MPRPWHTIPIRHAYGYNMAMSRGIWNRPAKRCKPMGRSYKILGMPEAATEAFRKSLALDLTNKDSRLELIALGSAVITKNR